MKLHQYAVRFRSTGVWGGFVSYVLLSFLSFVNDKIFLCKRLYCTTSCENAYDKGVVDFNTVKPLITNTSNEFIKCRLEHFSMSFILYYVNFSICRNR